MADDERLFLNLDSGFSIPESNLESIQPLGIQQNMESGMSLLQNMQQPGQQPSQGNYHTMQTPQQQQQQQNSMSMQQGGDVHSLQQGSNTLQGSNVNQLQNLQTSAGNNLQTLQPLDDAQSNHNLEDPLQDTNLNELESMEMVDEEEDVKPNIEDLEMILNSKPHISIKRTSSHASTSATENKQHGNSDAKQNTLSLNVSSNQSNLPGEGKQQQPNAPISSNDISLGDLNETLQRQAGGSSTSSSKGGNRNPNSSSGEDTAIESPSTVQEEGYYVYKCVFCEAVLTGKDQEPKILECLHNACGGCVRQKLFEQSNESNAAGGQNPRGFECTACGYFINSQNILDNRFLIESSLGADDPASKSEELKCMSCSDDALATSWCVECAEFICDTCVRAHQRLKITKDHTIKPKEEETQQPFNANAGQTSLFCTIHPNEKLSLFCEFCDKLTCRDCQLTEHRDHKYKFTHEIASDCRKSIHSMLTDISYKKVLLTSAMKVIDDRQTLITDKKQALVQEITNLVVRLTNTINVRGKQLVARLNEVCNTKQKTLDEKKVALDHLSKITDHCIQFTKNVLENGSDSALLYSKKHVTSHIQRIKSRRADIPNPEIPVRIHLALDKVPDLIKGLNNVISSIGQIVVDGRVYPSQTPSPLPPQNSPSPSQLPQAQQQQQSQQQQQQQQQPQPLPPSYPQQNRMAAPPAYVQPQYSPNMRPQMGGNRPGMMPQQQQQQHMNMVGNMQMGQNQQQNHQLGQNPHNAMPMQRLNVRPTLRPLLPHSRFHTAGINSQQQVTSSTHPQALHDRSNLRHLLQHNNNNAPNINNAVYVQTGPNQYQAVQAQLAHQYNAPRFQNPPPPFHRQQQLQRMNSMPIRQQMPQQNYQQMAPAVNMGNVTRPTQQNSKWHIPQQQQQQQQQQGDGSNNHSSTSSVNKMPTLNTNFKIMLKPQVQQQQQQNQQEHNKNPVTSTIPKTPSPNHLLNTEKSLDKFCEESVNDLMATIAKLDSNGVQVLAERGNNGGVKSGSPHVVDSSTGDSGLDSSSEKMGFNKGEKMGLITGEVGLMEMGKEDPNEDWCAVCMDGGELVCCDRCPKVFHQFCHIPNLSVEESDTWQCLLCMNFADVSDTSDPLGNELSPRQKKIAERLILELYCQYDPSLPFREVIGPENEAYHEVIKNPIALDTIRHKLDWNSSGHYTSLEQLVKDVRLMFRNCYTFNPVDSPVYNDAKTLEKFFDEQLEKWLPEYAYEAFEDDLNLQPPNKKFKRIITDHML